MSAPSLVILADEAATLPVYLFPSADSQAFDFTGVEGSDTPVALPAVGSSATVVQFKVPTGFHGIIKRIGNVYIGSGFTDFSGALQWQIQIDSGGACAPNYDNILASLGSANAPSEVSFIRIKENQTISLVCNNKSLAASAQLGGRLGGWFYPIEEEPEGST